MITDVTEEYRIEGKGVYGWILFDRTPKDTSATMFLDQWRKARPELQFRLMKVTITVTREIVEV